MLFVSMETLRVDLEYHHLVHIQLIEKQEVIS